ncbi:protein pangolin, isoforms A/H/I/S-like isoform X1 [Haematobia irritans]|uniref:protein pangolin, isoforms A/H/I/S-like isoform X1 n=2 Tax=Haematobia irritans TaxID=7368 RepID=UPI003F501DE6
MDLITINYSAENKQLPVKQMSYSRVNHIMANMRRTSSPSDDLGSTDELKIFKDEGGREDENISSENLFEEKSSLIDLTESEEKSVEISTPCGPNRMEHDPSVFNMGYLVAPYSYPNATIGGLPATIANRITLYDSLPPPAHCGIPPYQLDTKAMGLTKQAMYSLHPSQYPHPMLGPDLSQIASWHPPSVYSPPSSFTIPNILNSVHHRAPSNMIGPHHLPLAPSPKEEFDQDTNNPTVNHRYTKNPYNKPSTKNTQRNNNNDDKKKPHIKKPLNAFMLYMKEMRAKVVAECTLKESAAINQILGRRWHELSREEQSVYYEKSRRERQLHMELYPGYVLKNSKRKRERTAKNATSTTKKIESESSIYGELKK